MTSPASVHAVQVMTNHLNEGSAVLFTGAGFNFGIVDGNATPFPLGTALSELITREILDDANAVLDLQDSADMARRKIGDVGLNDFISRKFNAYRPGVAHGAAARMPWNAVYTTNFDTLMEKAVAGRPRRFVPISSMSTDLSQFEADMIPYYKIHGCVDHANTPDGRLVLTPEDYRSSEENRRTLFSRLRRDLLNKAFLFVGYGFRDNNLRQVLDEVRYTLGTDHLPPSFALRKGFSRSELEYWKDKYNVQLIDEDAAEFMSLLADQYDKSEHRAFDSTTKLTLAGADGQYSFNTIGGSFQLVAPEAVVGSSNAQLFFKGGSYTWADARDGIAPARDDYWTLMEYLFADFANPTSSPTAYLVSGAAGTGKSTLCRSIAYDIAKDFGLNVLVHVPGAPLDASAIGSVVSVENPQRIVVFVKDAGSIIGEIDTFVSEVRRLRWPVSLVVEERRNEWLAASARGKHVAPLEISLGPVSYDEIDRILDALAEHDCLGKLKGLDRSHQQQHFGYVASQELLVALRELTSDGEFDEIVRDEYQSIPSEIAKRAYLYVAAVGQANVALRYEHLLRLTGVAHADLKDLILRPTDQILIDGEVVGTFHASAGYTLRARHPIIASVIFNSAAPDDYSRYEVLHEIVSLLDPGYPEDRRLLEQFVRRQEIVQTLTDPQKARQIFDVVERKMPGKAFVLQQRSTLERHLRDPDRAVQYANAALRLEPGNPSLKNTLGFALELQARSSFDQLKRRAYLQQSRRSFDEGRERDPANPFNYIGLAAVMKTEAADLPYAEQALARAEILAFLEDAYQTTGRNEIVAKALAEEQKNAGDSGEALAVVEKALGTKEDDTRLRVLHVKLLQTKGELPQALQSALTGLRLEPNSPYLNLAVARLLRKTDGQSSAIRGHYDAAKRHKTRDLDLLVEYGAYLYSVASYKKAQEIFAEAQAIPSDINMKRKVREIWRKPGTNREEMFTGNVKGKKGTQLTLLATPANFEVSAWHNDNAIRVGDTLTFTVAFDAFGPKAKIVMKSDLGRH